MTAQQNLRAIGDQIESQLDELRATANPRACEQAENLLRLVTELYGGALARVVALAEATAPGLFEAMLDDELVASLLLVHGLHPDSLENRVLGALASVRPFLGQHGGDVELLDIDEAVGAVHLRLLGSCDGCPSSAITLQSAVERAVVEAAPEIVIIDVEEPSTGGQDTMIELGRKPVASAPYDPATGCGLVLDVDTTDDAAAGALTS